MPDGTGAFVVSGFGDEIAAELPTQLEVLEELGLSHIDLRGIGETHIIDLDDQDLHKTKDELDARGFEVTSIGSPIGKIMITEPFQPHLSRFADALRTADRMEADCLRVFSYYLPSGSDPTEWRDEVHRRLDRMTTMAEDMGVQLVLENERALYGATPDRARHLLTSIDSPALQAVFDPANFLAVGVDPYSEALVELIEFVEQVHVKDMRVGDEEVMVVAGEGDCAFEEIFRALVDHGFEGVVSLEPHLKAAGPHGGFSGPEGFRTAGQTLTSMLDSIGVEYR